MYLLPYKDKFTTSDINYVIILYYIFNAVELYITSNLAVRYKQRNIIKPKLIKHIKPLNIYYHIKIKLQRQILIT